MKLAFHHVGVVTSDLAASAAVYKSLGYETSDVIDDPLQRVAIVLCSRGGDPLIELIAPTSAESPATGWLARINAGAYHTCYEAPDLAAAIAHFEAHGLKAITEPTPAVAFGGRHVVFLWGETVGLLELVEVHAPHER